MNLDTPAYKDLPLTREFPLQNGNIIKATRQGEYDFWYLSLTDGQLPTAFRGAYTSIDEVKKAIQTYSDHRNIPLGEQPPRPEIKYKSVKAI